MKSNQNKSSVSLAIALTLASLSPSLALAGNFSALGSGGDTAFNNAWASRVGIPGAQGASQQAFNQMVLSVRSSSDPKAELTRIFGDQDRALEKTLESSKGIKFNWNANLNDFHKYEVMKRLMLDGSVRKGHEVRTIEYYENSADLQSDAALLNTPMETAGYGQALNVNLGSGPYVLQIQSGNSTQNITVNTNAEFSFEQKQFDANKLTQVQFLALGGYPYLKIGQGQIIPGKNTASLDGDTLSLISHSDQGAKIYWIVPLKNDQDAQNAFTATNGNVLSLPAKSGFPKIDGSDKIGLGNGTAASGRALVLSNASSSGVAGSQVVGSAAEGLKVLGNNSGKIAVSNIEDIKTLLNAKGMEGSERSSIEGSGKDYIEGLAKSGIAFSGSARQAVKSAAKEIQNKDSVHLY